ncbi:hypothetical protein INT43_005570 [Umbelopsis isabellina]|uniref:Uncharacterized protein n=1 Tax=Mortierella isabellina TaxID=91625 RepID=A0A8H7PLX8_MORIS|nr:hypothetical protein INT43_005570 [Umbelopsis isabellina]
MTITTELQNAHTLTPPLTPPLLALKDANATIKSPPSKPPVDILRKVLTITDGRDKALKLIQYFIKIILHHGLISKKRSIYASLAALASNFSTTRKIIRLGHIIEPAAELYNIAYTSPKKLPKTSKERISSYLRILGLVFGLGNDLADDIFCLSKINVLPASWAKKAEPWSYRCWFSAILIDSHFMIRDILVQKARMSEWQRVHALSKSKELEGNHDRNTLYDELCWINNSDRANLVQEWKDMEDKLFWLRLSLVKTMMDGGFCGYDLFHCQFSAGFQAWTGFVSGVLSAYKLWCKNSK